MARFPYIVQQGGYQQIVTGLSLSRQRVQDLQAVPLVVGFHPPEEPLLRWRQERRDLQPFGWGQPAGGECLDELPYTIEWGMMRCLYLGYHSRLISWFSMFKAGG